MNSETVLIAFGGWFLAFCQFLWLRYENNSEKSSKLLEQTLGYFERGTQARSIGLSLVEGIWLKDKKNLDIIVPVLVSQLNFLLSDADDFGQEQRNVIRLLFLLEKTIEYSKNRHHDNCEILEALTQSLHTPGKIQLGPQTLKLWYVKFGGDPANFNIEIDAINKSILRSADAPANL